MLDITGKINIDLKGIPRELSTRDLLLHPEKPGFQREGLFRDRWLLSGEWVDSVMLGLINSEQAGD